MLVNNQIKNAAILTNRSTTSMDKKNKTMRNQKK